MNKPWCSSFNKTLVFPAGSEAECVLCGEAKDFSEQIFCTSCGRHYHGRCLDPSVDLTPLIRMGWQCPDCKVCQGCRWGYSLSLFKYWCYYLLFFGQSSFVANWNACRFGVWWSLACCRDYLVLLSHFSHQWSICFKMTLFCLNVCWNFSTPLSSYCYLQL